jgi:hypothetical protein
MTVREKNPLIKPGRRKIFQMCILVSLEGPRANILRNAVEFMKANQFVGQSVLEQYIFRFNILDRGRYIRIEKFSGQLELDQYSELPCWNIFLLTNTVTTARCLARAVSKKLFNTKNTVHPAVKIRAIDHFQRVKKENRLSFPSTVWYPGYFSERTLKFEQLLAEAEVQDLIKEVPEKYQSLLEGSTNS